MRLVLVGTGLARESSDGAPAHAHNLAVTTLASYLRSRPAVAARWTIETLVVPHAIETDRFPAAIEEAVLAQRPDVLGLSLACWDVDAQVALAEGVRRARPGVRVVAGGPEAADQGAALLDRTDAVDAVVLGEGEVALERLLCEDWAALRTMPGTAWRDADGRGRENAGATPVAPLAAVPSPYAGDPGPALPPGASPTIECSRGCPGRCRYCSAAHSGAPYRTFPAARVAADLAWARRTAQPVVALADAALNNDLALVRTVSEAAAAVDPDRRLRCVYNLSLRRLTEEQVTLLGALGTGEVGFGINTTNPASARLAGRAREDAAETERRLAWAARLGPLCLHLILGLPGDDLAGFERSFRFVMDQVTRLGVERVNSVRVHWLVVMRRSWYWQRRAELGLEARSEGIRYAVRTRELAPDDFLRAIDVVRSHPLGELCVVAGPTDALRRAAGAPFAVVDGYLTALRPRVDAAEAAPGTDREPAAHDTAAEDATLRMSWDKARALVAPLTEGRPLRAPGWRVGGFEALDGWPVLVLGDGDGALVRIQIARAGTFERAYAQTARHEVVWRTDHAAAETGPVEGRLVDAVVALIRRNERRGGTGARPRDAESTALRRRGGGNGR